ncbi:MAG: DUF3021 domain-containing protein [Oscillospiraceae bacterium]
MKRKIISRAALGFPIGIAIGHIITVIISLMSGEGEFFPCVPEFVSAVGNEAAAVALQTFLCGIMGTGFAAASVIWEMDNISIAAQTGICLAIYAVFLLPIAYFSYWMEHSPAGILSYIGIFAGIFAVVWLAQYAVWKKRIKSINEKLKGKV